jgi:hypothetical protein
MMIPGAQHHQERITAVKALMNLVEVDEATFRLLLRSHERPTLVRGATGMLWFRKFTYMTSYDGFVFCHRSDKECDFRPDAAGALVIDAKTIDIPSL